MCTREDELAHNLGKWIDDVKSYNSLTTQCNMMGIIYHIFSIELTAYPNTLLLVNTITYCHNFPKIWFEFPLE